MAKKAKSTLLNMFLSLTVIAVVAAAVLALISSVTKEPIEASKRAKTENAIKAVLPPFDRMEDQDVNGMKCHLAYKGDDLAAVAVESASENGFGGHLGIMYGFDAATGNITGYSVLEMSETPGLGAKAGQWFQEGAKGCVIGKNPATDNLTVKKDGGDVDAISGSTITSRAFCEALSAAYETFQQIEK